MKNDLLSKVLCDGLPHGLIVENRSNLRQTGFPQKLRLSAVGSKGIQIAGMNSWQHMEYFAPYLRPLSDLTREIVHNGERFVPIEVINEVLEHTGIQFDYDRYRGLSFQNVMKQSFGMVYEIQDVFDLLNEWHFNWRNLPEDQYVKVTEIFNPYK